MIPFQSEGLALLMSTAFDSLKDIFRPDMSLDEVAEKYSPNVDDIIAKYQKEGVTFSAGKFKITAVDDKSFTVGSELYFQDSDKKWSKVAKTSDAMVAEEWLSKEAWTELKNVKEKIFDVEAPQ